MRSKAIPRRRKVKPALKQSQEEQNDGNQGENRQSTAEKSTNAALCLKQQHNDKSTKKGRKRNSLDKIISANESNTKMWEINQEVAHNQLPVTPIQELGGSKAERMDVQLPPPSIDTSDCSSFISQPVQRAFCFPLQSVGPVSGTQISQALPQAPGFSTTMPFERQENNVVSLRGKGMLQSGSGVKRLDIPQELIQRFWRTTAAKTSASIQKTKVTVNTLLPGNAADTNCKMDISGIAGNCQMRDNGRVRKSTKVALRLKVQSGRKTGNTGQYGKCLTIPAKVYSSEMWEQKQKHLVTDKKTPVVQPSMDSMACQSLESQKVQQKIYSNGVNPSVSMRLREIKTSQTLQRTPTCSAKISSEQPESDVISLRGKEISQTGAGEMSLHIPQERTQRLSRRTADEGVDLNPTVRSKETASEIIHVEQKDIDRFLPETVQATSYESDKPGISEYCVERDKGSVRKSTKDALRQTLMCNRKAGKTVKTGKSLKKGKGKSVHPMKLKRLISEQHLKAEMKNVTKSAEQICLQKNGAEKVAIKADIKGLSKNFGQIPATAKEQKVKLGKRKIIATFDDSLEQIKEEEENDEAGDDGNLPDFSKLFLK